MTELAARDAGSSLEAGGRADELRSRLQRIRDGLSAGLIERDMPIRLALLAAIAGEHLLLIGPPGTAKSELARRLRLAFKDQSYFERLLTRFSVPEELFGPLSIKALENDRYERQTAGYLPTAAVAFLDEIFKANSAILNALLTLLNEREFDNGTQRIKVPLVSVIGASNELPQEEELLALYDRFLIRLHVGPVTDDGFSKLLDLRGHAKPDIDAALRLTPRDLEHIHAAALKVTVPAEVAALIKAMRKFCQDQKIPVSDRRWRKALFLLQVAAHTDGRAAVSIWDCWLLQHCLWHQPQQRAEVLEWYTARIGEATVHDPGQLGKHVAAWEETLKGDREQGPQKKDKHGKPLFVDALGKHTTERYDNRQKVENKPVIETRHYTARHIKERTSGIAWVREQIAAGQAALNAVAADVEQAVRSHMWLDSGFIIPGQRRIAVQRDLLTSLDSRAKMSLLGFEALPQKSGTLPPELATLPPSMLQAFRTLAAFALNEQQRTGKPLEEILTIQIRQRPNRLQFGHHAHVGIEDVLEVPPGVQAAIATLEFSLDDRGNDHVDESLATRHRLSRYFKYLREYLVIDNAPVSVFRQLDLIEALIGPQVTSGDVKQSFRHIVGLVHEIRCGKGKGGDEPLDRRFEQFWSISLRNGANHFFDWFSLGLLTDED